MEATPGNERKTGWKCRTREDLLRPHVLGKSLDDGYKAMAEDQTREAEALEWTNALAKDMSKEAR